jgi:hypothetical protein
MNWFTTYASGSRAAGWFAFGVVILLLPAFYLGTYKTVLRMRTDKREEDEAECITIGKFRRKKLSESNH